MLMKPFDFYEYTDIVITYLNKQFVKIFNKRKSILPIDELNVLQSVKVMYDEAYDITLKMFLKLSQTAYKNAPIKNKSKNNPPNIEWVLLFLDRFDPVTKYVFSSEVDRKRARAYESIMATKTNKPKELDTALRYWSAMVTQYAIEITDEATLQAYKDNGIKQVRWITLDDDRVCGICEDRNNRIYDIDDIPPKPHIGCRCYLLPVEVDEDAD